MSIRTENGWHIDENNNRWDADFYTAEQAEAFSQTLKDCRDCSYCRGCSDCRYCRGCSYCSDCRENPQRIFGWKMGSRGDTPAVYWKEPGKEQCVVGCFRGTLDELEAKVKETHANNPEHLENYLKFIKKVRRYQQED